jgi:hypothetical protein
MELSPSWETANCLATQELPSNLWNTNVHYRVHKSLPLVPILYQTYPVHTTQKERDHWEDQDVGGWIILKWILER